jgi:RNA polymerase sigma-70 factor (ECF subfamily)
MAFTSSNARLTTRARAGDAAALDALFRRHWPATWRAALAVCASDALAEDAAQDAWLKAIRSLAAFDPTRPFGPWLRRIVVNCAIDAVQRSRAPYLDVDVATTAHRVDADPVVVAAVRRLPVERRVVVALRFWADLTVLEIAEALDIPEGTARSRLARALDDLRAMLEVQR